MTPCCGLEVHYPTQALKSVKGPGNTFDINREWQRNLRPSVIIHGICIGSPPYSKEQHVIGSKEQHVTGSKAQHVTGNDEQHVTGNEEQHMTRSEEQNMTDNDEQ
jgi:hypothetical protein